MDESKVRFENKIRLAIISLVCRERNVFKIAGQDGFIAIQIICTTYNYLKKSDSMNIIIRFQKTFLSEKSY